MKKVGILTYHNNSNRGANLQAYSLWKSLENNLSNRHVEIIDYRTISKEITRILAKNPSEILRKIIDFNSCINFFKKHSRLSSDKIITNNHKKSIEFLKEQDYDMIVVGSDEIWNLKRGIFSRPFPNAYFLDPSLKTLKVSYAASANRMNFQSLTNSEIKTLQKHFSYFDKISVRETHTEKILKKLRFGDIVRVPDPTILVDIPKVGIEELLQSRGINIDKPILCIERVKKGLANKIAKKYREKGYQIVTPTLYNTSNADKALYGLTPFEYFSLYQYFDMVVTWSYHSTIFCIKNNIPFVTMDSIPLEIGDKAYCLLKDLSLTDRYIYEPKCNPKKILQKITESEKSINKSDVDKKLKELRKVGIAYISKLEEMINEETQK